MRVLGVDPGIARLGYGVVEVAGSKIRCVTYGCVETDAHTQLELRLQAIYHQLTELLENHHPDVMAVEELFFNRNTTTAFTVGQARGVVLLAAAEHATPLAEYTPMQVKQAVTGYGRADKKQIQQMVKILLGLTEIPKPDDAADALAIAITHGHSAPLEKLMPVSTPNQTGWNWERGVR
ncbi:crossover junction endodeoxyribonuclease RuvC [Alicyclobacillus dauci]|uniref:Crossover junction endodeoxyribonuclease RuvC n=1 Tax=Alicyclobacillus dauci TaxID=1475485 RepID=A0ABY6ZA79_9BACL|nr:crossover junction endodeoxyribonuclease RuvC [Alicyclobacillus dauci]WAH39164.1 crossover junction endodeoxyribonuclease RuvC [Alicyclobacillus dauci]